MMQSYSLFELRSGCKALTTALIFALILACGPATALLGQAAGSVQQQSNSQRGNELSDHEQFNLAAAHYSRGAWGMALREFDKLITDSPNSALASEAVFYSGESLVELKRFAEAIEHFQRFRTANPDSELIARCEYRIAECRFLLGQPDQALRELRNFVIAHPESEFNEFALPLLGQLRINRNEPQLAQRIYEKQLSDYPESKLVNDSKLGLAQSLQMQGQLSEAGQLFRELADNESFGKRDKALLELGRISFKQGHHDDAQEWLGHLLQEFPSSPQSFECRLLLSRLLSIEEEFEQAASVISELESGEVDSDIEIAVQIEQARIGLAQNRIDQTVKILDGLLKDDLSEFWLDQVLSLRSEVARQNNDWPTIQRMEPLMQGRLGPGSKNYANITFNAGMANYRLANYRRAVVQFENCLATIPDTQFERQNEVKYWMAIAQLADGNNTQALQLLNSLDSFEQNSELEAAIAYATASVHLKMEGYLPAIPHLIRYLNLSPSSADELTARKNLVIAYLRSDSLQAASASLDSCWQRLSHFADRESIANQLAWSAQKSGLDKIAAKWFAVLKDSHDEEIRGNAIAGLTLITSQSSDSVNDSANVDELVEQIGRGNQETMKAGLLLARKISKNGRQDQVLQILDAIDQQWQQGNLKSTELIVPMVLHRVEILESQSEPEVLNQRIEILVRLVQQFEEFPHQDQVIYRLAWARLQANQLSQAKQHFTKLVETFTDSTLRPDSIYRLAKINLEQGKQAEAEAWLNKLVESTGPDQSGSREALAFGQFQLGKMAVRRSDWQQVNEKMNVIVEEFPESRIVDQAKYWLAESAFQTEDLEAASELFQELVNSSQPRSRRFKSLLRIGQIKAEQSRWNLVAVVYQRGVDEFVDHPDMFQLHFLMGRREMARGKFNDAREHFLQVANLKDKAGELAAQSQWLIGETYFHQENYQQAITEYYLVESRFPVSEWHAAALLQAGKCYEKLGETTPASKLYRYVIQQEPGSGYAEQAAKRLDQFQKNAVPASFSEKRKQ